MKEELIIELKSMTGRINRDEYLDELTKSNLRELSSIVCEMNNGSVDKINDMAKAHMMEARLLIEQMSTSAKLSKDLDQVKKEVSEVKDEVKNLSNNIEKVLSHLGFDKLGIEKTPDSADPPDKKKLNTWWSRLFDVIENHPALALVVILVLGGTGFSKLFEFFKELFIH